MRDHQGARFLRGILLIAVLAVLGSLAVAAIVKAAPLEVTTTPYQATDNTIALDVFIHGRASPGRLTVYAAGCSRFQPDMGSAWPVCGREVHRTFRLERGRNWRHGTIWLSSFAEHPYVDQSSGPRVARTPLRVDGAQVVIQRGPVQVGPVRWFIPAREEER